MRTFLNRKCALAAGALCIPEAGLAQEVEFSETIVVTGRGSGGLSFETRHGLEPEEVNTLGAGSADEIIRRLPSLYVPVNSRGEAIAFVRNAGERQVAIFYEGAAINVPWDNRLDLSLFPAALIGSIRAAAGPLAPHYGVNAIGALSLSPRTTSHAMAALGTQGRVDAEAVLATEDAVIGGSYSVRDGEALSDRANTPFSQPDDDLRTNTDRRLTSAFVQIGTSWAGHDVGLTALHVEAEKGTAPEGNRASGARFWRYPEVRHTLFAANAISDLGNATELTSAVWYQRFGQAIENYASVAYDRITLKQVDRDNTWGLRNLLKHKTGPGTLVVSFNYLDSTHRQRDIPFMAGNPPAKLPAPLLYRQRNWSIGGEFELEFNEALRAEIGAGYDQVDYVRTGDKPAVKDAKGWTGRAGLVIEAGGGLLLRATAGRKMRAPTLRERFGEAINRFLINPDLLPERIATYEIGAEWRGDGGGFFVIPFHQDLKNTIDQRNVGSLRQRINLPGSTVWGVEAGGEWRLIEKLHLSANGTWTRVRRKHIQAGVLNRIAEKPSLIARARLSFDNPVGISGAVEMEHVGRAYSADTAGILVPLQRSTSFNAHLAYGAEFLNKRVEVFARVGNLSNTLIEPQLGLPAPGRSARVGIRLD